MSAAGDAPPEGALPDEGFLRRWSRRKLESRDRPAPETPQGLPDVAAEHPNAVDVPAEPPVADSVAGAAAPAAEPEPPGDADMPPLASLGPDSNVSAFFSPRVSESLRRAALRRLFHQAKFNVTDGLDDYNADYRKMSPLGKIITADMRLALERNQERLARLADRLRPQSEPATRPAEAAAPRTTIAEGEEDHGDT